MQLSFITLSALGLFSGLASAEALASPEAFPEALPEALANPEAEPVVGQPEFPPCATAGCDISRYGPNGPKLNPKNNFWSTRGREGTVVELCHYGNTLGTFAGRNKYGCIEIKYKSGEPEYYAIPFNGGTCSLPLYTCGEHGGTDISKSTLYGKNQ